MLTFFSEHSSFEGLFQKGKYDSDVRMLPFWTQAAAFSRKKQSFVLASSQGVLYSMTAKGEPKIILDTGGSVGSVSYDFCGRIVYTDQENAAVRRCLAGGTGLVTVASGCGETHFSKLSALSLHSNGMIYFADDSGDERSAVYFANPIGLAATVAGTDTVAPTAVCCSAGNEYLYVADAGQDFILKFNIASDGKLEFKRLHGYLGTSVSGSVRSMFVDAEDRLFAVTEEGIAVFDAGGMLLGRMETQHACTAACFGGPTHQTLHVFCGDELFQVETVTPGTRLAAY